jgi:hypothetical protein
VNEPLPVGVRLGPHGKGSKLVINPGTDHELDLSPYTTAINISSSLGAAVRLQIGLVRVKIEGLHD